MPAKTAIAQHKHVTWGGGHVFGMSAFSFVTVRTSQVSIRLMEWLRFTVIIAPTGIGTQTCSIFEGGKAEGTRPEAILHEAFFSLLATTAFSLRAEHLTSLSCLPAFSCVHSFVLCVGGNIADCEICTSPVSTNPASTGGVCFVASRLSRAGHARGGQAAVYHIQCASLRGRHTPPATHA